MTAARHVHKFKYSQPQSSLQHVVTVHFWKRNDHCTNATPWHIKTCKELLYGVIKNMFNYVPTYEVQHKPLYSFGLAALFTIHRQQRKFLPQLGLELRSEQYSLLLIYDQVHTAILSSLQKYGSHLTKSEMPNFFFCNVFHYIPTKFSIHLQSCKYIFLFFTFDKTVGKNCILIPFDPFDIFVLSTKLLFQFQFITLLRLCLTYQPSILFRRIMFKCYFPIQQFILGISDSMINSPKNTLVLFF